jgi:hypothetical protein
MPLLPVVQSSEQIIMYRVFHTIVHADKVVLIGAYGNEWEGRDLIGRCGGEKPRYDDALAALRSGYVVRRKNQSSDTRQLCIDHLRQGEHTCGVWGYRTVERLKSDRYMVADGAPFDRCSDNMTLCMYGRAEVLAAVRAWGVVLEGEYGWRASAARLEYIWVPPRVTHVSASLPAAPYYCPRSAHRQCDDDGVHIDPEALLDVLCEHYGVRGQVGGDLPD